MFGIVGGAVSRFLRRTLAVAVVVIVVSSGLWGVTTRDSEASDESDRPLAQVIPITVTNTLSIPRPNEVVRYNLTLPDGDIIDPTQFRVVRSPSMAEVLSGPLEWTVLRYPSNSIYRMQIVFQDSFSPLQSQDYDIRTGEFPTLLGDMTDATSTDAARHYSWITVRDGATTTYSIQINNAVTLFASNAYYSGVFVQFQKTGVLTSQGTILTRLGGNQLQLDQTSFSLSWGDPTTVGVYRNSLMRAVHLVYTQPQMLNWGPGGTFNEIVKTVDVVSADVWIYIYNDRDMVETFTKKEFREKVYNHNGVVEEFTVLFGGQGEYETIYGNPEHVRMWATTQGQGWGEPRPDSNGDGVPDGWVREWSTFAGIDHGNNSAPDLSNFLDSNTDGDLDLVIGSLSGTLYGYRNVGTVLSPVWQYEAGLFGGVTGLGAFSVPKLYDLTADGLKDLIVGQEDGTLRFYRNTGTQANPAWTFDGTMFQNIDVGDRSAPEVANVNGDLLPDLLVGDATGRLTLYINTGTLGSPVWTLDNALVDHLNAGATRKPGTYSTPVVTDVNRDGNLDLITGKGLTNFGSIVYFENEGDNLSPKWTKLVPGIFNNVRGARYEDRDFSVPAFGDLDGDGFEDIAMGGQNGTISFWRNQRFTVPESHVNNMQPLENGSYRFYYDQDSNDGQYVIRNESSEFWGYYVEAKPDANAAVFRYVPDFARLAHRDRYGGDQFPWAGGNTSYYPFIPQEDGMITRALAISRVSGASGGYGLGGTFLSQTGTAGGFIQVPMTSMVYDGHEVMVAGLPYDPDASTYDDLWRTLSTAMDITDDADLAVDAGSIISNPTDPSPSYALTLSADVANEGYATTPAATAGFYLGDPDAGGSLLGTAQAVPPLAPGERATVTVNPGWFTPGLKDIYVKVTTSPPIPELDPVNNKANRTIEVSSWTRDWNGDFRVTFDDWWNGLDPYIAEDAGGDVWIAYHKYTTEDDFGIYVRRYVDGDAQPEELVVSAPKRTSGPVLVPDAAGNMWLIYASNVEEWSTYQATKNARYYWSMKFDLWAKRWDGTQWLPEQRITTAVDQNRSHQEPQAALGNDGKVWVAFRETGFELYSGGNQMNNIPYRDMNVSALFYDAGGWSSPQTVSNAPGSQAFWGGPAMAVDSSGNVWVVYGTEIGETQWDLEARSYDGVTWSAPMTIASGATDDYRPAITVDSFGRVWTVWERRMGGGHDLYYSFYDGVAWTLPQAVDVDPGDDRKPALAADGNGNVWLVWESDRGGNTDLFAARWTAGWSSPMRLTGSPASDEEACVFIDSTDKVWIAWQSDRNGHGNMDIYVKAMPAVLRVEPPRNVWAALTGASNQDVTITWDPSASEDGEWGPVAGYEVWFGQTYDMSSTGYTLLASLPIGSTSYVHAGAGQGDPNTYFYAVRVRHRNDNAGLQGGDQGGKLSLGVAPGITPLMAPFDVAGGGYAPGALFATLNPSRVWQYDVLQPTDPWRSWSAQKATNDLTLQGGVQPDYGIWVEASATGTWTTAGKVRQAVWIGLRAGWNFVGDFVLDPSYTVGDLMVATGATRVEGYDSSAGPYFLRQLQAAETLQFGHGYWIHVPADMTWYIWN